MAGGAIPSSSAQSPQIAELDRALNHIGMTGAHRTILLLIVIGGIFDSFEQNSIGIVGPILRQFWGLTAANIGFLNTVTFASAALGRVGSGYIGDRFGRRVMLTIDLLLFTVGALICAFAPDFTTLSIGRFIVGFGLGGEISIAVTMLAEFCSARSRGTVVGLLNVGAGGIGNFLAPAFGLLVFAIVSGPERWRWLFGALALPALLVVFYRRFIPETPRFLLSRGKVAEANAVLSRLASGRLTGPAVAVRDYIALRPTEAALPAEKVRLSDIFRGRLAARTIPVALAIWMTYGAQITVLTLMPTILVAQGYTITRSLVFTMVMQGGSLLGAIAASVFGYHLPRKRVLTFGAILACLAAIAFGFLSKSVLLILICGATFQFFVLLLNTTLWIYAPELYPTRVRAFGTAFILATGTLAGAVMPLISGRLFDNDGIGGVFGLIAVMYAIFAGCVQVAPETYGRSLEDPTRFAEPLEEAGAASPLQV